MLIGLTGTKGSGKDTAASFLEDYSVMKFARPLKQAIADLFDLDDIAHVDALKDYMAWIEIRHPLSSEAISMSWRTFLQRFGTEMARQNFGSDFWVDQWEKDYDNLFDLDSDAASRVVVTDVRFPNEAARIHRLGGSIIEIQRSGYEPDGHESEKPLPRDLVDTICYNTSNLEQFKVSFLATVEALKHGVTNAL